MQTHLDFFTTERQLFEAALKADDLKNLLIKTNEITFVRMPNTKKSIVAELIKNVRDTVKGIITKINEIYSLEIIEINLKNTKDYGIINKLFEIVLEFDEKFKNEKYQAGYLDFKDLEHLTISLLEEDGTLREEFIPLRDSFDEILVDEYQDTNKNQNNIVFNLAKALDSQNIFVVGDDDQIIFSFQGAKLDTIEKFLENS